MVEFRYMGEPILPDKFDPASTIAVFTLDGVHPDQRLQVTSQMVLVGNILSDGKVTVEEAAQLMAFAYPDLAGQLAHVLEAAQLSVEALRDDGKVSMFEALGILAALMAGIPSLRDATEAARGVVARMLGLRGK